MSGTFLVTGGTGCIGAATVRWLVDLGADEVVVASRSGDRGLLPLWFEDGPDPRVVLARADVGDAERVKALVAEVRPDCVVHLGALQSPDCDAHPDLGLRINVGGTLHLLRAAESIGTVTRFVFASSAAVYGVRARYPGPTVRETDELAPPNLYGVWKLAGEQLARQFQERSGIATVCLRLNTTYGKGRDRGRTSAPTVAMKAIARGAVAGRAEPFRMPYGGRENYHFVRDVGAHFAQAAVAPFTGFGAFNLRGETIAVEDFLARVRAVAGELGLGGFVDVGMAPDATPNPFVCDLDDGAIQSAFRDLPRTPIEDGIRASLEAFVALAERGELG